MQLSRYLFHIREVKGNTFVKNFAPQLSFYRHHNKEWYAENGSTVSDVALLRRLRTTKKKLAHTHWRPSNSCAAYFRLEKYDAVLEAMFTSPSKSTTRDKVQSELELCEVRAENWFDATHDLLTGLLNGPQLEVEAQAALENLHPTEIEADSAGTPPETAGLSMLALDIDHFKQVNDTWGHIYGDAVLQCLAMRLASSIKKATVRFPSLGDAQIARPSGEEFLVLLPNIGDAETAKQIAEAVRIEIEATPLPSEKEWARASAKEGDATFPQEPERHITVSIGVSTVLKREELPSLTPIRHLRNQADKALYSVKNSGRNAIRHFNELLNKFGTILEHNTISNVVAVDMGKNVGVQKGQEFKVYHPSFTGDTPFYQDTGRSLKRLGNYPKVTMGQIVVFDVQQEISFATPQALNSIDAIPVGARLEAISLGSIAHLVEEPETSMAQKNHRSHSTADLTKMAKRAAEDGKQIASALFTIKNSANLAEERGAAYINSHLADLYRSIQSHLSSTVVMTQLTDTQFVVLSIGEDWRKSAESILDELSTTGVDGNIFCAGYFDSAHTWTNVADNSQAIPERAVEYAQLAAAAAQQSTLPDFCVFNTNVACSLLLHARNEKRHNQGLREYQNLLDLGFTSARTENLAGLLCWESPETDIEGAISHTATAVKLDVKNSMYWCNLGFYVYYNGQLELSNSYFKKAYKTSEDKVLPATYLRLAIKAGYYILQHNPEKQDLDYFASVLHQGLLEFDENEEAEIVNTAQQGNTLLTDYKKKLGETSTPDDQE